MDNELQHYGVARRSGRYPWGSGDNPYQHEQGFLGAVKELQDAGYSEKEIAEAFGISTTVLRARKSVAKDELKAARIAEAWRLKEKGYSNQKIGEILGAPGPPVSEGTVRNYLKPGLTERANETRKIADGLKAAVEQRRFIDVGKGSELYLGVSQTKLNTAVQLLQEEGYELRNIQVDQMGTDHKTTVKVLCPPGTQSKDIYNNLDQISLPIGHRVVDTDTTSSGFRPPVSINPDRVAIRYAEEGGRDMDGVIQLRRGVADLTMGDARYAQVRIKVGEDRYLKGMAMYADDLPEGVDIMFNTNKHRADAPDKMDVLKKTKDDPDNPFGATCAAQRDYIGKDGKEHQSPLNIVNEEGDWDTWSKTLSSQFLSKQPVALAKNQLDLSYSEKKKEFDEITSLTNPTVKKKLLEEFADGCDAAAVHLKAAALPRQASKAILPFPSMTEDEVYAPGYRDGEKVALVRYPHGGIFEIPTLTVNNKDKTADSLIHNARDAIGINPKVAEQLSGADFDGDTVLVIPISSGAASKIRTSRPLKQLENFDPKEAYRAYEGMPKVGPDTGFHKQMEMGKVSNLITDMTIKGASEDDIARAVKHSMVVIDAEKHNLNWRQSYVDNGIAQLKEEYQGGKGRGASTLISRAKSTARVEKRSQRTGIDEDTGEKLYYPSKDQTYTKLNEKGELIEKVRTTKTTKMGESKDARSLMSDPGTPMELVYAEYANSMKSLANQARKEYLVTPSLKYSPSAAKAYAREVASLNDKLLIAKTNAPLERLAQIKANIEVKTKKRANPNMDKDELKRLKGQALTRARIRVGAKKTRVNITRKEWEAIQAGAITNSKLAEILDNSDIDVVRSYATPRASTGLSSSQVSRAKSLLASGNYTQAEVADQLGVSVSTLSKAVNE